MGSIPARVSDFCLFHTRVMLISSLFTSWNIFQNSYKLGRTL